MAETVKIDIFADSSSIRELKQQLLEARNQLSGLEAGSEDFIKVAQRAGQLKDQMVDINEQVAIFASGSKFEQAGTALGQIKNNLANLDFEGAAEKAKGLTTIVQGISFKTATAGLKDLGSTFLSLGKALLTNPLFLIAAVIAGIAFVIYKLLDSIGVVKAVMKLWGDYMKMLGKIIDDFIIQPLKDLTDWLGITANAAEDSAQRQADAAQMVADKTAETTTDTIQALDNEIRIRKLNGENTRELERQKLVQLTTNAKAQADADKKAFESAKLKGELDAKEIEALKKKARESRKAYGQMIADIQYFDQENGKLTQERLKKEEEDAKTARDKAIAAAKQREDTRIEVERRLIDINLSMLQDGYDKERALLNEKYKRDLEDIKRNEKYNAEQKAALKLALEKKQFDDNDKLNQEEWQKKMAVDGKLQTISTLKTFEQLKTSTQNELKLKGESNMKTFEEAQMFRELELNAEQNLADAKYDLANSLVDALTQVAGKNKAIAEVAFLASKGLAIAQIVTNTLAEISGIASNPALTALPDLGASVKGPAIIAAKVRAGAQIATIAATTVGKYVNGGNANIPSNATPNVSTPAQPSFQLFGQANQGNTVNASSNQTLQPIVNVTSTVSVSEITKTQQKMVKVSELASL
jgi:hypothetical protein